VTAAALRSVRTERFMLTKTTLPKHDSRFMRYRPPEGHSLYPIWHPMIVTRGRIMVFDAVPGARQQRKRGEVSERAAPGGVRVFTAMTDPAVYVCVLAHDRHVWDREGRVLAAGEPLTVTADALAAVVVAAGEVVLEGPDVTLSELRVVQIRPGKSATLWAGAAGAVLMILRR